MFLGDPIFVHPYAAPLFEMFQTMFLIAAGTNQYDVSRGGAGSYWNSLDPDQTSTPLSLESNAT